MAKRGGAAVARVPHKHQVAGSNPAPATKLVIGELYDIDLTDDGGYIQRAEYVGDDEHRQHVFFAGVRVHLGDDEIAAIEVSA